MQEDLNRPKRFGEILDTVFTLSRQRFMDFVKIFFIIIGPIYILMALYQLTTGVSFFREMSVGANWFDQIANSFLEEDGEIAAQVEGEFMDLFFVFLPLLFFVFAQVAVLFAVDRIRRGEAFTVNEMIKRAFSRFWPLLRGSILFAFIFMGLAIALILISTIIGAIISNSPLLFFFFIFIVFIGVIIVLSFFSVRLSFYIGAIAFGDKAFSSMGKSWRLTRGRFWIIFGIYFVFSVIIGTVNTMFEFTFGIALGNSVLFGLLVNAITLVTTMLTAVGYAVVYLDLHVRHDSSDLKEMIADYDEQNE